MFALHASPSRRCSLLSFALIVCVSCAAPAERPSLVESVGTQVVATESFALDDRNDVPALAHEGDLASYLELGLRHSPSLQALEARLEASLERGVQERALPNPVLSYTEFVEELQTRTGPNERRVRLDQSFPWPGLRGAKGALADADAARLASELDLARLEQAGAIADAWLGLAFAHRSLAIAREELELLGALTVVVQSRVETGGPREDWINLEIEIARVEDLVSEGEDSLRPRSARLAGACGFGAEEGELPATLEQIEQWHSSVSDVRGRAAGTNPRARVLETAIDRAEAAREVAERADRPSLGLGVEYIDIGDPIDPTTPGGGDDPVAVRMSIGLPVWRDSYAAAGREAERGERAARLELDAWELELQAEIESAIFDLADADRGLELCRSVLSPRSTEAFELTEARYAVGEATFAELIDAERAVLGVQLESARALRDRGRAIARLAVLTGDLSLMENH